ncbi:MAG: hypothetical protein ACXV8Q_10970 [Methylobacter sp.]
MACKCHQLPGIPSGAGKIMFTFPDEMFRENFITVLEEFDHTGEQVEDLLTVVTHDAAQLIRHLCAHPCFSDREMDSINAVILQAGEQISFSLLNKLKSLNHWSGLFAADDLLYVLNNRTLQIGISAIG